MNFQQYAEENYTHRGEFEMPRGFADATKLNTVDGETQNYSFVSPLRTEFYTETAIVAGAITDFFAAIQFENSHNLVPALVFNGSSAVMGIAAVVRHRARKAVNSVI